MLKLYFPFFSFVCVFFSLCSLFFLAPSTFFVCVCACLVSVPILWFLVKLLFWLIFPLLFICLLASRDNLKGCCFFLGSVKIMLTAFLWSSGPVVMDLSGYTEKGFKRKLAVQALFGKLFYLSEVRHWTVKRWPWPTAIDFFFCLLMRNTMLPLFLLFLVMSLTDNAWKSLNYRIFFKVFLKSEVVFKSQN